MHPSGRRGPRGMLPSSSPCTSHSTHNHHNITTRMSWVWQAHLPNNCNPASLIQIPTLADVLTGSAAKGFVKSTTCMHPTSAELCNLLPRGGFKKWGYPNSWMVYKGKSYLNGWFRGTPIDGNPHVLNHSCSTAEVIPHFKPGVRSPFSLMVALQSEGHGGCTARHMWGVKVPTLEGNLCEGHRKKSSMDFYTWRCPEMGKNNPKWMVYNGRTYWNDLGNLHVDMANVESGKSKSGCEGGHVC